MTSNDDTGNPARLPLAERQELEPWEIARLEFPGVSAARRQWLATLQTAIYYGLLPARVETRQRPGLICNRDWLRLPPIQDPPRDETHYFVARDAYRIWRATQPDAPVSSLIHPWLGAPILP